MHHLTGFHRILCFLTAIALSAAIPNTAGYAKSVSDEDRVKAAFVYNFIKFVEWPSKAFSGPEAPLNVCVWGTKAETGLLDTLHEKTAKKRPIHVVYTQSPAGLAQCHLLYLTKDSSPTFKTVIRNISGQSILSVSDIDDFAESGGLIGLFRSDNQMRFAINLKATQKSGLRMSSGLLKLGKIVAGGDR